MSGVAGGDRISQGDIKKVVNIYIKEVLQKFPAYVSYTISGSFKTGKKDSGDIDLIILFDADNKKQLKLDLIEFLLKQSVILPFRSDKYRGRRYYNSGELVTILYSQGNGKTVQIDNIAALSLDEMKFKEHFLNLPAEKQGLLLGAVKVAMLENDPNEILQILKISADTSQLKSDQEYEFNLSSSRLELRKVTLDVDYKTLDRESVWESVCWEDVTSLIMYYNFDLSFEKLLSQMKRSLTNERSGKRITGLFNSMITVKIGEVGTDKGIIKELAREQVKQIFKE